MLIREVLATTLKKEKTAISGGFKRDDPNQSGNKATGEQARVLFFSNGRC